MSPPANSLNTSQPSFCSTLSVSAILSFTSVTLPAIQASLSCIHTCLLLYFNLILLQAKRNIPLISSSGAPGTATTPHPIPQDLQEKHGLCQTVYNCFFLRRHSLISSSLRSSVQFELVIPNKSISCNAVRQKHQRIRLEDMELHQSIHPQRCY